MKRLPVLLLSLLLAACASAPRPPEEGASRWELRRDRLLALERWGLAGRLAIRTELESWSLSLRWRQEGPRFDVVLVAPFGQGSARLEGDDHVVVLRSSRFDGEVRAEDPQRLLEESLGWEIPVAALRFWVRGLPAPGPSEGLRLDGEGRVTRLVQRGWEVELDRYAAVQGVALPRRIFLSRGGESVRLVVQQWRLGASADE